MSFVGVLNRIIGNVKVVEKDGVILVDGINPDAIQRGIRSIWNTSKIANNLFIHIDRTSFSFPSFFAIEIVFILTKMTEVNSRQVNVRQLSKILEEIKTKTWLSKTTAETTSNILNFHKLDDMVFEPLPFQLNFLKSYNELVPKYGLNGFILNGAPGSGKTFTGLALAQCLEADRIVIVCPANAVERVWKDSLSSLYKRNAPSYWIAKFGQPYSGEKVLVVHYEALSKVLDFAGKIHCVKPVVILDESHNVSSLETQRTENFIRLCQLLRSKHVIYASGTPVKAMGEELIPILRVIDPLFTPNAELRYRKIYGKDATKALDILNHRFGLISFKIEKKELKLLPPIIEKIKVKSSNGNRFTLTAINEVMKKFVAERQLFYQARKKEDQQFFYDCLKFHEERLTDWTQYKIYRNNLARVISYSEAKQFKEIVEEIKACNNYENKFVIPTLPVDKVKKFKEVRTIVKYVALKIQGECLGRVLGRARIDCYLDMLQGVDFNSLINSTKKKTIIFTSYVEVLNKTNEVVSKMGFKPLVVYGETNNNLANIVKEFEINPDIDPLIATFNSLSTAVPLTMADVIIMLNVPFRSYIQDQAISRINRLGANTQTYVYLIELDTGDVSNISSRTLDILAWSQQQVAAIVGGDIPFDITEMSNEFNDLNSSDEKIMLEHFNLETTKSKTPVYLNW